MYTAVSHLLYNSPRAPRLLLVNVGHEFIPFGKASFAQVVETLRRANPDDVAVGLLTEDGSMMICPAMRFVHEFGPGDKIILLTRRERRFGEEEEEAAASDGSFPTREPSPELDSHRTTVSDRTFRSFKFYDFMQIMLDSNFVEMLFEFSRKSQHRRFLSESCSGNVVSYNATIITSFAY